MQIPDEPQVTSIDWQGPFSFEEIVRGGESDPNSKLRAKLRKPGVYLWIDERAPTHERLQYVGKALGSPDLWYRLSNHFLDYISGRKRIPRKSNADWDLNIGKQLDLDVLFDRERFHALIDEAFTYAERLHVYLCPLERSSAADINDIERNLIFYLQPRVNGTLKRSQPPTRRNIVHHNANWASEAERQRLSQRGVEFA